MSYFASVIIPTHNNARRLAPILIETNRYLHSLDIRSEIILMDLGSTDATLEIIHRFKKLLPNIKFVDATGRSEAQTVKAGLSMAKGRRRILFHPESRLAFNEFGKALHRFEKGADIVVGTRFHKYSHNTAPGLQVGHNLSKLFHNLLINGVSASGVGDSESGLVCMRDSVVENIIPQTKLNSAGYILEILAKARATGYKLEEFPVSAHGARPANYASYKNLFQDSLALLRNRL